MFLLLPLDPDPRSCSQPISMEPTRSLRFQQRPIGQGRLLQTVLFSHQSIIKPQNLVPVSPHLSHSFATTKKTIEKTVIALYLHLTLKKSRSTIMMYQPLKQVRGLLACFVVLQGRMVTAQPRQETWVFQREWSRQKSLGNCERWEMRGTSL